MYCNFHKRYEKEAFCPLYDCSVKEQDKWLYDQSGEDTYSKLWPYQPKIVETQLPRKIVSLAEFLSASASKEFDESANVLAMIYSRCDDYINTHILYRKRLKTISFAMNTIINGWSNTYEYVPENADVNRTFPWVGHIDNDNLRVYLNVPFCIDYLEHGFDFAYMRYLEGFNNWYDQYDLEYFYELYGRQ